MWVRKKQSIISKQHDDVRFKVTKIVVVESMHGGRLLHATHSLTRRSNVFVGGAKTGGPEPPHGHHNESNPRIRTILRRKSRKPGCDGTSSTTVKRPVTHGDLLLYASKLLRCFTWTCATQNVHERSQTRCEIMNGGTARVAGLL